jgi:hypothetical protein
MLQRYAFKVDLELIIKKIKFIHFIFKKSCTFTRFFSTYYNKMKRVLLPLLALFIGLSAMGQQTIQLRSADRAECVKSDMTSLKASFSFSTIEAEDIATKGGDFSWLSMPNTIIGGNEGDPQIPVVNELIAVPFGA